MHIDAYDKAAARTAERATRSLTAAVILLIAVTSVTTLLPQSDGMKQLGGPVASAFFLLAGVSTWFLFRLRSIVKRSVVATELMAAENCRLRESEERYRTIVTATPELILICRSGLVDYINGNGTLMLGARSADLILARPVADLLGYRYRLRLLSPAGSGSGSAPGDPPAPA